VKRLLLILLAACASVDSTAVDIKATVLAEYNVLSGPAGRRDWDRFKELFAPGAVILIRHDVVEEKLTPDEYIAKNKPWFTENALFAHPVSTEIQHTDRAAHVVARDESRHASNDDKPYAQGVTTFDLVLVDGAWKITSIVK